MNNEMNEINNEMNEINNGMIEVEFTKWYGNLIRNIKLCSMCRSCIFCEHIYAEEILKHTDWPAEHTQFRCRDDDCKVSPGTTHIRGCEMYIGTGPNNKWELMA